ncbi:hypothetical protein Y1Q_0009975 [Alligator mississippiensis]|uniref:Uncharacterized protein n=1 Tax=Alligator mississippiensis TaxID=8496 RepID=A0A151MXD2_ALLMI|nr:hypothetical protein Y1Q_0009975 [Alligator mississippiensis]
MLKGWTTTSDDKIRDPRSIVPTLHKPEEQKVTEDMGIMNAGHPAGEDVGEVALVVNILQDNQEVALEVDECLGNLGWAEDGDMGAVHGPHAVGEAHAAEDGDYLLRANEAFDRDFLNNQRYFLESLFIPSLAYAELVSNVVMTAGGDQLHDSDGHLHLQKGCREAVPDGRSRRTEGCHSNSSEIVLWEIEKAGTEQEEGTCGAEKVEQKKLRNATKDTQEDGSIA